jgi:ribosome maturation factor RimP
LQDELAHRGLFLVEALVKPANRIVVYIDSLKGVTLEECMQVSRFLEKKLDRDAGDFELEVSSPGLDRPLKLPAQYEKNMGRMLDVVKYDGMKITGKLAGFSKDMIRLEEEIIVKDRQTGKKNKTIRVTEVTHDEIKSATVNISLKSKL